MSVLINFSIFPMDKGDTGLSRHVARAIEIVEASGLPHELGPMGTSIEGEWEDVMAVINACYHELEKDSDRLFMTLTADAKKGRKDGLTNKVRSVQEKIR
ncbi:MTH1187 family thiamine-binding protein [Pseudodesulfovibrio sp. JC047]|uniref:MTH1187 family thiamine-binding protein n=1 Tax=Pseudodesulfovibrio sp. JC047 TaxID=2683199 RepID=UPI0013D2ABF4|nr:MTH1187 family thiamine-binding protein [Pseudodesulfovibrio sp. JC047]NDV20727.1 MTH1187 family thiamine-binding protein [Pseudodesulfovibrio sp. JC047]